MTAVTLPENVAATLLNGPKTNSSFTYERKHVDS